MTNNPATTVVIDAGVRYGMHPSWTAFTAPLSYIGFEPDPAEAQRLEALDSSSSFKVVAAALGRRVGRATLNLHKHRGCSSLLETNLESGWFKHHRPGEGIREDTVDVPLTTIDVVASDTGNSIDFLKIDTEGTELDVLEGASRSLGTSVLGVRINTTFQEVYKGQAQFCDLHAFLSKQSFFLLNLDYFGRGTPRNALFRNPDPLTIDTMRYGVLIGTDAVWMKDFDRLLNDSTADQLARECAALKYASFALLNGAPDVGADALLLARRAGLLDRLSAVAETDLYRFVRRQYAEFMGRWRGVPDHQWDDVRAMYEEMFGIVLPGGNRYWELLRTL